MSAAKGPDRVGWPCACGCMQVVPPFEGKGEHVKRYATDACRNRDAVKRCKSKRRYCAPCTESAKSERYHSESVACPLGGMPARVCGVDGCIKPTFDGKPWCADHVATESPYAAALVEAVAKEIKGSGSRSVCELCGEASRVGLCAKCARQIDADDGRPIVCMATEPVPGEVLPFARPFKSARGRVA